MFLFPFYNREWPPCSSIKHNEWKTWSFSKFSRTNFTCLGNQAPDVIVAFVLGDSQDDEGPETSFGPLLGSGLIVVGFVLSTVIYLGKKVIVTPGHYTRDLLVYQISLIYVFYLGWVGEITLIQAIMFFVMYIINGSWNVESCIV